MLFLVKRRNHAISDLENPFVLRKMLRNFERFLNAFRTHFERSWTRTLFLRSVLFDIFHFLWFPRKNSLKIFKLFWNHAFTRNWKNTPKIQKHIQTVKSGLEHFFPIRFPKTWFSRNRSSFSNLRMYQVLSSCWLYMPRLFLFWSKMIWAAKSGVGQLPRKMLSSTT